MKIEVGKIYNTRHYGTVRVIATDANEPQPIVGLHKGMPETYTVEGKYYGGTHESGLDLVSEYVEPPKPREVWVSVYSDGDFGLAYKKPHNAPDPVGPMLVKFREVIEA